MNSTHSNSESKFTEIESSTVSSNILSNTSTMKLNSGNNSQIKYSKSVIEDIFSGETITKISCLSCSSMTQRCEKFFSISIPTISQNYFIIIINAIFKNDHVYQKKIQRYGLRLPINSKVINLREKVSNLVNLPENSFILAEIFQGKIKQVLNDTKNNVALKNMIVPLVWDIILYEIDCDDKPQNIEKEITRKNRFILQNYSKNIGDVISLSPDSNQNEGKIVKVVDKSINGIISPFYVIESERLKIHKELSLVEVQNVKPHQFRSIRKKPEFRYFLLELNNAINKQSGNKNFHKFFGLPFLIRIGTWFSYSNIREQANQICQLFLSESKIVSCSSQSNTKNKIIESDPSYKILNSNEKNSMKDYKITLIDSQNGRCFFCKNLSYDIEYSPQKNECNCEIPNSHSIIKFSENDNVSICVIWNEIKLYSNPKIIEHGSYRNEAGPECRNMKCELEECLNLFQKSDIVDKYFCEKCKEKVNVNIFTFISTAPDVLIIHLKRFKYQRNKIEKITTIVNFPLKGLSIKKYSINQEDVIYDLFCVINHFSKVASAGHYTTYILEKENSQWIEFDDDRLNLIDPENVVSENSYILYYKKRYMKGSNIVNIISQSLK